MNGCGLRQLVLTVAVGASSCSAQTLDGQDPCGVDSSVWCPSNPGRLNYVANPEFDQGLTGWSTDPERIAPDTSGTLSGPQSAHRTR